MIGINQQIKTDSGGGEGVGFAVPIDVGQALARPAAPHAARSSYAYLGVETVAIYPQLRERFDLPVAKGAWVQRRHRRAARPQKAGAQGRRRRAHPASRCAPTARAAT